MSFLVAGRPVRHRPQRDTSAVGAAAAAVADAAAMRKQGGSL